MYCVLFKNGRPTTYDLDEKMAAAVEAVIALMPPMPTITVSSFIMPPEPKIVTNTRRKKKPKFTTKRDCLVCKKPFVIKGPTQRLCSPKCVKRHEQDK